MPKLGSCSQFLSSDSSASVGCWATCMGPCMAELGQSFIVKIDLRHVILSSRWARCEGRVSAWMLCVPRPQPTTPGFGESCPHEIHETKDLGTLGCLETSDLAIGCHWSYDSYELPMLGSGAGWNHQHPPLKTWGFGRQTTCVDIPRVRTIPHLVFFEGLWESQKTMIQWHSMTMKGLYNVCCFQLCISTSSVLANHSLIIWSTLPAF